jgi:hypothetical protein
MTVTRIPAPIFFTVPAQVHLQFKVDKNIIAEYFNVIDDGDTLCSDIEIGHYSYLQISAALDKDGVKHRAGSTFFECIASHLRASYPNNPEFKRYVSLFRFTNRC